MQRYSIADGVYLNVIPSVKFKTNFLSVNFLLSLTEKNATGTSALLRVLLRSCKKYPSTASLASRLEYLYDMSASMRNYKRGETLITSYESEFLKDDYIPEGTENMLSEAVGTFRDIVLDPRVKDGAFDEKTLSEEKTDLVNTINALINNKNSYAKQKCTEIMCENEKYALNELGTAEDAKNVTASELFGFYREFIKTSRIEIYFVGECDENALCALFKEIFSGVERKPSELCDTFVSDKAHEPVIHKKEVMNVSQGKLAMGFRTGATLKDANSADMIMFNEIFGSSPVSKLFMNVREKLSLCYYCRSVTDSFKGVMFVMSGIENCNREKAVTAILSELRDICDGKLTQSDIDAAVLSVTNSYKELSDNPSGLSSWYLSRRMSGDLSEPSDVINAVSKVTADDIANAAKRVKLDTVCFLEGGAKEEDAE